MKEYIETTCKIGQGAQCCKYLLVCSNGFECAKVDSAFKEVVDRVWATAHRVPQGDNCRGSRDFETEIK
jgi:hypothetical protein